MQIELLNQYYIENHAQFKKTVVQWRSDVFIMVVSGSYSILPVGRRKPIVLRANEIAFIPEETEVSRELNEITTYYHLSFRSDAEHPYRLGLLPAKLILPADQSAAILKSLSRAYLLPNNREPLTHIIEHIFFENNLFGKTEKVNLRPLSEEVLGTIRYMNQNLNQDIAVSELAARVFLSHTGLIWKFKHELGTTPLQYLILLRLRRAKQLLLDHPYSISEIAEMCGFSNPFYFTNAFRRYAGVSPSEFRRQHLGGKGDSPA
ncbi:MAG: helix-turn-helix transcriptional regulator [Ruminococcaceae bacterium]|nr:helix-turn-helix transcriptional regulator [Oscillospiraceae bacterium]